MCYEYLVKFTWDLDPEEVKANFKTPTRERSEIIEKQEPELQTELIKSVPLMREKRLETKRYLCFVITGNKKDSFGCGESVCKTEKEARNVASAPR